MSEKANEIAFTKTKTGKKDHSDLILLYRRKEETTQQRFIGL